MGPRAIIRDYDRETAEEDAKAWSRIHKLAYVVVKHSSGYEAREETINKSNYYSHTGTIVARFVDGEEA